LSLWEVANGITFDVDQVVFSTDEFVEENQRMTSLPGFMPFDGLYFIGSLGCGDLFALGRTKDGQWHDRVLIWEHETDDRYEVEENLRSYVAKLLLWWARGDE
jgi:hypothetical protein